ncbi:MAG: hypothetical protein QM802_11790 [Agriterribacter sp.]
MSIKRLEAINNNIQRTDIYFDRSIFKKVIPDAFREVVALMRLAFKNHKRKLAKVPFYIQVLEDDIGHSEKLVYRKMNDQLKQAWLDDFKRDLDECINKFKNDTHMLGNKIW